MLTYADTWVIGTLPLLSQGASMWSVAVESSRFLLKCILVLWPVTSILSYSLIARLMGPTWGPSGAGRNQVGPILAPWTLLSGFLKHVLKFELLYSTPVLVFAAVSCQINVWSCIQKLRNYICFFFCLSGFQSTCWWSICTWYWDYICKHSELCW